MNNVIIFFFFGGEGCVQKIHKYSQKHKHRHIQA